MQLNDTRPPYREQLAGTTIGNVFQGNTGNFGEPFAKNMLI